MTAIASRRAHRNDIWMCKRGGESPEWGPEDLPYILVVVGDDRIWWGRNDDSKAGERARAHVVKFPSRERKMCLGDHAKNIRSHETVFRGF